MTFVTLAEVIKEECKDKRFAELFQRQLLINEVAKIMVEMRKHAKLTQQGLAKKAGTTQPAIARLERGLDKRIPSLQLLSRLANAANAELKISLVYKKNKN